MGLGVWGDGLHAVTEETSDSGLGGRCARGAALAAELSRCVFAGLTNGFGGVRSEQEPGGLPGRKATPRRRCASESSIASSSSPLCDTRWATGLPSYMGLFCGPEPEKREVQMREHQVLVGSYSYFSLQSLTCNGWW